MSFGFWISSFSARADTPTTLPKPPEGAYDVYEWVIFIADPSQPQLNTNAASLYDSTLPDFVGGRRNPAPSEKAADPTPLGVIRFSGSSGSDKVDILVTNKGGKFLAHWPKATNRQTGVLWQNFVITDTAPASQEPVGGSTWFEQLRSPAGPFVLKDGRGERFLAYDLEPSHKLDLKVSPGSSPLQYSVSHNTKLPLLNLTFYKPADDGWHTATVASLQPTNPPKASTKPAATKAAAADGAPNTNNGQTTVTIRGANGQVMSQIVRVRAARAAGAAETTAVEETPAGDSTPAAPATAPSTRPTTASTTGPATTQASTRPAGTVIELSSTGQKDPATVLAPWKDKLAAAGLPPTDFALITSILQKHALDSKRLTAVYCLDANQMEELLPLEVTPQPRKTVRVGLVIVRNIDPAIITEIDSLIAQLGDDSWPKREAAFNALEQLGLAAKPKLEATLKNAKDPEVIYRLERLIAALTQDPNNPMPRRNGRR